MTQNDDFCSMETDSSSDESVQRNQMTTPSDSIEECISFRPTKQREISLNYGQTVPSSRFMGEQLNNNNNNNDSDSSEDDGYEPHASCSSNDPNEKFPRFRLLCEENQWSQTCNKEKFFFVRKQARSELPSSDVNETGIALDDSKEKFSNLNTEERLWYHATSWSSAIEMIEEGLKKSKGPSDMAYDGAFYLNPDYRDCYNWFEKKKTKFEGKYAMLIFKFDPTALSKRGKDILDRRRWKTIAAERSQSSSEIKDDWTYTYQSARPDKIGERRYNGKIRERCDNQPAMQLIIYSKRMCEKVHRCLIGCVYYENCYS